MEHLSDIDRELMETAGLIPPEPDYSDLENNESEEEEVEEERAGTRGLQRLLVASAAIIPFGIGGYFLMSSTQSVETETAQEETSTEDKLEQKIAELQQQVDSSNAQLATFSSAEIVPREAPEEPAKLPAATKRVEPRVAAPPRQPVLPTRSTRTVSASTYQRQSKPAAAPPSLQRRREFSPVRQPAPAAVERAATAPSPSVEEKPVILGMGSAQDGAGVAVSDGASPVEYYPEAHYEQSSPDVNTVTVASASPSVSYASGVYPDSYLNVSYTESDSPQAGSALEAPLLMGNQAKTISPGTMVSAVLTNRIVKDERLPEAGIKHAVIRLNEPIKTARGELVLDSNTLLFAEIIPRGSYLIELRPTSVIISQQGSYQEFPLPAGSIAVVDREGGPVVAKSNDGLELDDILDLASRGEEILHAVENGGVIDALRSRSRSRRGFESESSLMVVDAETELMIAFERPVLIPDLSSQRPIFKNTDTETVQSIAPEEPQPPTIEPIWREDWSEELVDINDGDEYLEASETWAEQEVVSVSDIKGDPNRTEDVYLGEWQ